MTLKNTKWTWRAMISRCSDPSSRSFHHYGGRGISFDPKWLDFNSFLQDMGLKPNGKSIDRIDVNGNYCKENCRWATQKQQMNNTRVNVRIEFNGQTKTMSEWATALGIRKGTLWLRLKKFPLEKAMTSGVMKRGFRFGRKFPNRKRPQPNLKRRRV